MFVQTLLQMRRVVGFSAIFLAWSIAAATPANAAGNAAQGDLQSATRALGFLDTLQNHPVIVIGVVYSDGVANNKSDAARIAGQLATMPGPNSSIIRANVVTTDDLAHATQHFDALYLMLSAAADAGAITDYVRRQHVVSISNDPACLDAGYCVLMVQAGSRVNIVLDTAMAKAAGAQFSTVFMMMVKRR